MSSTKYLKDYTKPSFLISTVSLTFELDEHSTRVTNRSQYSINGQHNQSLNLVGEDMELESIAINGQVLAADRYQITPQGLTITDLPNEFELTLVTLVKPLDNTKLEGLYVSDGAFCTQCEAEGFRRITYYLDRPDVMAIFTTKVIADHSKYPYLLSNGNKVDSGLLDNGLHFTTWHDPFKKPAYLFALVAGDFDLLEGNFITRSGRDVLLQFFVDKGNKVKAEHALASLQRAMKWDEQRFDLEYDLDIYMVVAVDFFNMGAMENKGLNIFNSKYVLADVDSATDTDFHGIESVIGHEYFHNWTGNRITCRDWFQLSLKEGLTVFRDQEFSSDLGSRAVNRIDAVKVMRSHQFAEDASPMAHPIRPTAVIEMNNFYTVTVYNKGAEVIRMIHTLLGEAGFMQGMAKYIELFDGMAVTCDDFIAAMEQGAKVDLGQFRLWYQQSGTPIVTVTDSYDQQSQQYQLTISQENPAMSDGTNVKPLHIPVSVELISLQGESLDVSVLELTQASQVFTFNSIAQEPVPSLLRDFSAPVKLVYDYSDQQLSHLVSHASSDVSRWDSAQKLLTKSIIQNSILAQKGQPMVESEDLEQSMATLLAGTDVDPALLALMIELPSVMELFEVLDTIDVDAIISARNFVERSLSDALSTTLLTCYQQLLVQLNDATDATAVAGRALKNAVLRLYTVANNNSANELVAQQFKRDDNMTDSIAALSIANQFNLRCLPDLSESFEAKWLANGLVMDKWFSLKGANPRQDVISDIISTFEHPTFSWQNPNRVRSLLGGFISANPSNFHRIDGSGYQFLTDQLIKLNRINPQIASRLITPLLQWQKFEGGRSQLMKTQLQRLAAMDDLASDLSEKVSLSLK